MGSNDGSELLETSLASIHRESGASMVPFAGWRMPVRYDGIGEEHTAVREAAGLFDLGHMGRVRIRGREAVDVVSRVQTVDAASIPEGRTRYALVCEEDGGIVDDVLVSREPDGFLLVVNAANRSADLEFFQRHARGHDCEVVDDSLRTGIVAVQGPRSPEVLEGLELGRALELRYYRFMELDSDFGPLIVSRTGYTGEDGFEVILDAGAAPALWRAALEAGRPLGLRPCGLGARDTLRLEAGMPLYGHEIDRSTNPFEANLGRSVELDHDFVGADSLRRVKEEGPRRRLVGLIVDGPRIPRQGCPVVRGGEVLGDVRSGTRSPTLDCNIATAMVSRDAFDASETCDIDIRGRTASARLTKLPFYKKRAGAGRRPSR